MKNVEPVYSLKNCILQVVFIAMLAYAVWGAFDGWIGLLVLVAGSFFSWGPVSIAKKKLTTAMELMNRDAEELMLCDPICEKKRQKDLENELCQALETLTKMERTFNVLVAIVVLFNGSIVVLLAFRILDSGL